MSRFLVTFSDMDGCTMTVVRRSAQAGIEGARIVHDRFMAATRVSTPIGRIKVDKRKLVHTRPAS